MHKPFLFFDSEQKFIYQKIYIYKLWNGKEFIQMRFYGRSNKIKRKFLFKGMKNS